MLQYVWFVVAIGVCYCNHFRIVLQLVGVIAMTLYSCISIDFRCNYLVLLQQYWIWLHLLVAIAKVILGCNNLQWCCNCLLVIATRILKWLQYHVPIATVFWGCNNLLRRCNC